MKIIFSAHDAGGCDSLLPVIKAMTADNEIMCIVLGKAKDILDREDIEYVDTDEFFKSENIVQEGIQQLIRRFRPDIVVTGTSLGLTVDKYLVSSAKSEGIKTISIIDYWSNYWPRFKYSDIEYLPDITCVIDDIMKKEMIADGFQKDNVKVTGNPRFDSYVQLAGDSSIEKGRILFVSQPFSEMEDVNFGYNEIRVLEDVIEVLNKINDELKLVVRPHPRDSVRKFDRFIREKGELHIEMDTVPDISESINRSRLIIGMSSIILFQAALTKKQVISYQPGVTKDISILNKLGVSKTVSEKSMLAEVIQRLLGKSSVVDSALINKYTNNHSTDNVMEVIEEVASK